MKRSELVVGDRYYVSGSNEWRTQFYSGEVVRVLASEPWAYAKYDFQRKRQGPTVLERFGKCYEIPSSYFSDRASLPHTNGVLVVSMKSDRVDVVQLAHVRCTEAEWRVIWAEVEAKERLRHIESDAEAKQVLQIVNRWKKFGIEADFLPSKRVFIFTVANTKRILERLENCECASALPLKEKTS